MHGLLISTTAVWALAGATVAAAPPAANPTVSISNGQLRGGNCAAPNQAVNYFYSIPYAQAPTGDLRFAPPKSYDQKYPGGAVNATVAAPACPQFGGNWVESGASSEDCLKLNVWKPASIDAKAKLPVRVFIHGGGNTAGGIANPMYDGCDVAHDNVMVSINYRLGPLGFLALDEAGIPGNQGIQDIMQGLQWVQSNIGAFGGNPRQVVVHGQSSGAADAYAVATLDEAPKLMNGFISESGAGRQIPEANETVLSSKDYASALKCDVKDIKCFRGKSLSDLTNAFGNNASLNADALVDATIDSGRFSFGARVDGKIIPKQPYTQAVRVPSIFGVNSGDGSMFAEAYATGPKGLAGMTSKDYDTYLKYHFADAAPAVAKQYPVSDFKKSPFPTFAAISQIITDSAFLCPANRALNTAAAAKVPVWTYYFDHTPHCAWDPQGIPEKDRAMMGASHGAELPFVMGHTYALPRPAGACQMTSTEQKTAAFLKQAFTYFAANQKPVQNTAAWQAWTPQKLEGLHVTDNMQAAPLNYSLCQFWDGVWAKQEKGAPVATNGTHPKTTTTTGSHPKSTATTTSSTHPHAATGTAAGSAATHAANDSQPGASASASASGKSDPLQQNAKSAATMIQAQANVLSAAAAAVVFGAMMLL